MEVVINEVSAPQKSGLNAHRPWRSRNSSEISPNQGVFAGQFKPQTRTPSEENRQLPRGSYTQIMVNLTQLSDTEFMAWMDRLVEARRNRQDNKPRLYRQFTKL